MSRNPWAGLRGLPRDVWVLCAATLVNRSGAMALTFLVLYLTRLGWSVQHAGFAMALYGLGGVVASPIAGRLSDRLGQRQLLVGTLFLSGVFLILYPVARSPAAIVAATLLWSFSSESFRPVSFAWIGNAVGPDKRKPAFAAYRLAINLGMSIGPAIGGVLARVSMPALFVIDGATSIAAAFVLAIGTRGSRRAPGRGASPTGTLPLESGAEDSLPVPAAAVAVEDPPAAGVAPPSSAGNAALFADPRFVRVLLGMLLLTIAFFQVTSTMGLDLVVGQHIPETAYGLLFTINCVMIVFLEVPLNVRLAHRPHNRVMAVGAILIATGLGAIAFAHDFRTAAVTMVIWTFGEMILFPASNALLVDVTPAARRGEAMGLYTATFGVGCMLAPLLGTWVLERWGADAAWAGAFAVGCIAAWIFVRVD